MQLDATTLIYWKKDHNARTNEDALALDPERGLYVVCDGVGEASFSNEWAPVLARSFIERPFFSEDPFEVEHWTRAAQALALPVMTDPETLSGVSREKARRGAAATLCGLEIVPRREHDGPHYGYNLTAIGDSNFFHWRPDPQQSGVYKLLMAFPFNRYADFDSSPDSLNSRNHNRDNISVQTFSSTPNLDLREGDILFLATDAVSQWIFREYEATLAGDMERHPLPSLLFIARKHNAEPGIESLGSPWADYIDRLRQGNEIVDDDSIMIILRVGSLSGGGEIRPSDPAPRVKERTKELLDAIGRWLSSATSDGKAEVRDVDIAVAFGDGSYIDPTIGSRLSAPARFRVEDSDAGTFRVGHRDLWRANADAFKRVTDGVRAVVRADANSRQYEEITNQLKESWQGVREQLIGLLWMQGLVKTLRDMGIEPPEGAATSDVTAASSASSDPAKMRQGTEQVYRAIGAWITGRGSDAAIVDAFDANPHIEPAFAAAIATPIAVGDGMVSHMDVWRTYASGADAPTTVPPRKQVSAHTTTVTRDTSEDDSRPTSAVPLPPMPGVPGTSASPQPASPLPSKLPGDATIPTPKQTPPSVPLPPPPSGGGPLRQASTSQVGYMPMQQTYAPPAGRTFAWAAGGAGLLGVILLGIVAVWLLTRPASPEVVTTPVPATGTPATPNASPTALALANRTATSVPATPVGTALPTNTVQSGVPTQSAYGTPAATSQPTFPITLPFPFATQTPTLSPSPSGPAPGNPSPPAITPPPVSRR